MVVTARSPPIGIDLASVLFVSFDSSTSLSSSAFAMMKYVPVATVGQRQRRRTAVCHARGPGQARRELRSAGVSVASRVLFGER